MDLRKLRKYGKPPKKVISAEQALGIAKKTKMKKHKKSKKLKKDRKLKKAKPKPKAKGILSKSLKRAPTTEQSIQNNTQQQFLQNLYSRLNNNNGRTNGLWNSYKRNITAQSFGGTPYEMYRLQEESTILREQLEKATNDGRTRPQVFSYGTQTDTSPITHQHEPRTPPTSPPTTPPPTSPPTHLGFRRVMPPTSTIIPIIPFTGQSNRPSGAMTLYKPQPTTTPITNRQSLHDRVYKTLDRGVPFNNRTTRLSSSDDEEKSDNLDDSDDWSDDGFDLSQYMKEENDKEDAYNDKFERAKKSNQAYEDVNTDIFSYDFDINQQKKNLTQEDRDRRDLLDAYEDY